DNVYFQQHNDDLPLVLARNITVTYGLINLKYNEINLGSIYGIYEKISDRIPLPSTYLIVSNSFSTYDCNLCN
ncbi:MAG: hypothetical protein ACJ71P_13630, partial [Nitrososphaeraceae archaeon]